MRHLSILALVALASPAAAQPNFSPSPGPAYPNTICVVNNVQAEFLAIFESLKPGQGWTSDVGVQILGPMPARCMSYAPGVAVRVRMNMPVRSGPRVTGYNTVCVQMLEPARSATVTITGSYTTPACTLS